MARRQKWQEELRNYLATLESDTPAKEKEMIIKVMDWCTKHAPKNQMPSALYDYVGFDKEDPMYPLMFSCFLFDRMPGMQYLFTDNPYGMGGVTWTTRKKLTALD